MKAMMVDGGLFDYATLHPLASLLILAVAGLAVLRVARGVAARRRPHGRPGAAA